MKKLWVIPIAALLMLGCGGGGEEEEAAVGSGTPAGEASLSAIEFASVNTDGDDRLNEQEWTASGLPAQAFVDFDGDQDGFLSEAEAEEAKTAGDGYTPCDASSCGSPAAGSCMLSTCQGGKGECLQVVDTAGLGLACDDGDSCTSSEYCQEDGTCAIFGDGQSGTEFCQFDTAQQGKDIGNHIKNFGMKKHDSCPYWMHQNCGTDKKVIWMILGTGW